jgi:hypothetical protein
LSLELAHFLAVFFVLVSIRSSLRMSWISTVLVLSEKRLMVLTVLFWVVWTLLRIRWVDDINGVKA